MEPSSHRWRVADLIKSGKLVVGDGYRAKNSELSTEGVPFARAGNVNNGLQFDAADRFPEEHLDRVGQKVSRPGDVVFTSKGTVGRFAYVRQRTPRFVYSPQLCFWRSLDESVINSRFLYYWMYSREFSTQVRGVAGKTDMAEYVSLGDQRMMHVTLPNTRHQEHVAEVLGALDDKIELNRSMHETHEALSQAVFDAWVLDAYSRAADAAGIDKWHQASLDRIADFLNGAACQKYPVGEDGESLPVVKIRELHQGITPQSDRVTTAIPEKWHVRDGDVLFSWSGTLLAKLWTGGDAALNQHLFKVTSAEYPKWFYFRWVLHHLEAFRGVAADKATTMGHIKRHHLTDAVCLVPPPSTLERLDDLMAPLLDRQLACDMESRTLTELRDTLLPKLISGDLRMPDAERLVGEVT